MRTTPYPAPRSRTWQAVALAIYLALAASGGVVGVFCLVTEPITAAGRMILIIWSLATLIPGLACAYGVARAKYRWEWVGAWPLSAGVGVYAASVWLSITSPWDLANCFVITALALSMLQRAIQLGLIDRAARAAVLNGVVSGGQDG